MSSEGFIVSNPKGNNKDLEVTFVGLDGARKKLKTLRPGESCRCDKREVRVASKTRPPRLLLKGDGSCVPDRGR